MNSNQRSQGNNQTDNGGNKKTVSSSRGGTVKKDLIRENQPGQQSQQSGEQRGSQQGEQRPQKGESQKDSQIGQQSTHRTGSQTGSEQQGQPGQKQSNDLAGGYPRSPAAGRSLAADENMDDDTGLSNRANRQVSEQDQGSRQTDQSNVGRRDDGTPD